MKVFILITLLAPSIILALPNFDQAGGIRARDTVVKRACVSRSPRSSQDFPKYNTDYYLQCRNL
jgi:hypothetical protein